MRRKKIKLKISLRKKIKGKEISCWCIGHYSIMHYSWCYCRKKKIEDDNGTNTFRSFNPTQAFLHFKKILLLTHCKARANLLVIILLLTIIF